MMTQNIQSVPAKIKNNFFTKKILVWKVFATHRYAKDVTEMLEVQVEVRYKGRSRRRSRSSTWTFFYCKIEVKKGRKMFLDFIFGKIEINLSAVMENGQLEWLYD